jgi:peroxiredoxin
MRTDIVPGALFPDYNLADHRGTHRALSELQGGDPLVLVLSRGGFCPKERRQHEGLLQLHREMQVGYCRLVTISTDNLLETNEFRNGVGAHWTFLSDPGRKLQKDLDIAEYTDPQHNPMIRTRWCSSRACVSTRSTTATGSSAGRRSRSCVLICAPCCSAAVPIGTSTARAASRLGERRQGRFLSVRKNAGADIRRTGLVISTRDRQPGRMAMRYPVRTRNGVNARRARDHVERGRSRVAT